MDKRLIGSFLLLLMGHLSSAQAVQKDTLPHISIKTVPSNYSIRHLGYFCQKELQLQKLTKTPVFIRLGSKEYVDYLEQKPNARRAW
ncbi:MAG: hypothetical protein JWP88_1997 [Flaviaesturariibacter sp.]|nr:hypothetical protein [Flaviaesturariibacter sp.]